MEIDNVVYGSTFDSLEKAIKETSNRHKAIAQNIANIESNNYKSFQTELDKAQSKITDKQALLDNELSKLAENNLKMTSYAQLMSSKLKILRKVVTLGKG